MFAVFSSSCFKFVNEIWWVDRDTPHFLFHRLVRPDAKKFALRNLIWDPMISALLEACQGILNYRIMTVMGSPLKSTMGSGNLKPRTTRSLLLPSLSFHQQQRESIFMQEHCSLFASCSSTSSTGPYIYDKTFIYFFHMCKINPISLPLPSHEGHCMKLFAFAKQYVAFWCHAIVLNIWHLKFEWKHDTAMSVLWPALYINVQHTSCFRNIYEGQCILHYKAE